MTTDSLTDWIVVALTAAGMGAGLLAFVWNLFSKISEVVKENSFFISQLNQTLKAQWDLIGDHGDKLSDHGVRIATVETRLDYHEKD